MRKKSIFIFLITMIVFTFIFSACTGKQKKVIRYLALKRQRLYVAA